MKRTGSSVTCSGSARTDFCKSSQSGESQVRGREHFRIRNSSALKHWTPPRRNKSKKKILLSSNIFLNITINISNNISSQISIHISMNISYNITIHINLNISFLKSIYFSHTGWRIFFFLSTQYYFKRWNIWCWCHSQLVSLDFHFESIFDIFLSSQNLVY